MRGFRTDSNISLIVKSQSTKALAGENVLGKTSPVRTFNLEGESGIALKMNEYVADLPDGLPEYASVTKGSVITNESINQSNQKFAVHAYLGSEIASMPEAEPGDQSDFHFIDGRNALCNGSSWNWEGGAPQWRYGVPTTFWSFYPVTTNGTRVITLPADGSATPQSSEQASISFTYTLPTANLTSDAQNQEDLLFAYNKHTCADEDNVPEVDVYFKHALAAVLFDVTGVEQTVEIENIKLTNIYSTATCSLRGTAPRTFTYDWDNRSTLASFGQDVDDTDFSTAGDRIRQPFDGGKVFFMIPQTLASESKIEIKFKRLSDGREFIHSASIAGDEWIEGKYYVYAVTCTGLFGFDLMDEGNLSEVDTDGAQLSDSHYSNAILRFSGVKPSIATVTVSDPFGGASFNPLSAYDTAADWLEFGLPAAKDQFAGYPGSSSTVNIRQLLAELGPNGSKAHFVAEDEDGDGLNDWYYTQVFINENFYAGESPSDFVNKPDRSCTISLGTGNVTPSSIVFSQKSIQSPYDLSTAANPIGVEFVEESTVTAGTSASDWCSQRNRAGSSVWRTPTLQEYWNIWYGTHSIDDAAWLGLSTSPAPAQYLSSDGFAYNGQMSATIASPSGTGTVRCVRDLGSGTTGSAMSSVSALNGDTELGEASKIFVLSTSNVSSESLREKIEDREISGTINPGAGADADDNKLYSSIQVGTKYLTWPVSNQVITFDKFEYNLAVEKDRDLSMSSGFEINCTSLSGGFEIEGKVKMVNPDPRLVYSSSFVDLNGGGKGASNQWSYLDENGVLHFHVEYKSWSAQNAGAGWKLTSGIKGADGTVSNIGVSNICTLYFAITKKTVSGDWGTAYSANPPSISGGIMIGDAPIPIGAQNFRLVVVDGGPYSVQNVTMPKYSELFEGTGEDDNKQYLTEYACHNYYYEDTRTLNGQEIKSDLGQWRAPNQRELSMILEHSAELPIYRSMPTGNYVTVGGHSTPEYLWSLDYNWANPGSVDGDKISSLGIKYGNNPYYNANGLLINDANAPYRVRCVRDR